ncbi:anaerobic ribonucleoside-triphosphate reductase activating protein [Haloimpatiens lingqiaonensis]|uniref:anaerobic ribonucleoside-triphosphate reductase activating protein n=1 Tax=Haloimpatiens lingqiaonensis TaxID=1380675 RepID=UPI0010FEBBBE|nr:anaerobic ribonucleoside-triphosphate reductase activating protein [Haloimpatiens lingqiaonensis]
MNIRVAGFLDNSLVNGEGIRSVLFVSGCNHKCVGCHNEVMQDFNYGEDVSKEEILSRIKNNVPIIKGVTFSGGEPFEKAKALTELARSIKELELNIWCYTGYTFEEIFEGKDEDKINLLKSIDVLIDGKFDINLTEDAPKYAGSKNQRIIDVKASLMQKKVILK